MMTSMVDAQGRTRRRLCPCQACLTEITLHFDYKALPFKENVAVECENYMEN